MTQSGVVISINLNATINKNGGGTYQGWELIYKNDGGEVKAIQKPAQSLKYNKALANALSTLAAGDEFTVEMEKNQAGFWDVKGITKGRIEVAASPAKSVAQATSAGRDFEGKEERTLKQRYIVRQSSINQAIELLSIGAKAPPNQKDVLDLAAIFEGHVFRTEVNQSVLDIESDIPY